LNFYGTATGHKINDPILFTKDSWWKRFKNEIKAMILSDHLSNIMLRFINDKRPLDLKINYNCNNIVDIYTSISHLLVLPSTSCWQKEDNGKWGFRPYVQMLANNNIGASKIITKMQFDTKSPTPKLLFSPVGVLTPEQLADVEKQAKSQTADNYIKLTVYKPKEEGEAPAPQVAAPQAQPTPAPVAQATSDVQSDVVIEQPTLRAEPAPTQKPNDVSSIVKKWSVKT
jgi:hypothetical protein